MFSLLLPLFFGQLFVAIALSSRFLKIRQLLVKSLVVFFTFIALTTEFLSLANGLEKNVLILWWLAANIIICIYLVYKIRISPKNFSVAYRRLVVKWKKWTLPDSNKLLIGVLWVIYPVVLVTSFSPPSTPDSMTYHLARVENWIQNQNVSFFPTQILRQLYQAPLAEFSILQLQVLSGGDYFANLVQFVCFVGCGISASLIAEEFGLGKFGQLLAAAFCAATPMALLQGSSTQNDLVVSLFTVLFLYFSIRGLKLREAPDYLFSGLSLGLALLTKGTAFLFCFPIGVLAFGYQIFSVNSFPRAFEILKRTAVIVILALTLNAGYYIRNWQLFGTPITTGEDKLANAYISIPLVASNLARNYMIHVGSINETTANASRDAVVALFGKESSNPDSTYFSFYKFYVPYELSEDSAGNPVSALLLTFACAAAFWYSKRLRTSLLMTAISVVLGFFIFCLILRWQPWASRLHLPLFMMGSSLVAWFALKAGRRGALIIAFIAFLSCMPALFLGKPWALNVLDGRSRVQKYFQMNPSLGKVYVDASTFFRQTDAGEIGLDLLADDYEHYNWSDWEYPFWVLIRNGSGEKPIFRHVGVKNVSNSLNADQKPPEWVISTTKENTIDGAAYDEVFSEPPLRILHRKDKQ